jgi:hypothetical protein
MADAQNGGNHRCPPVFGAGIKVRIASGLALRPEIRFYDTTIGTGYNWSHMRLSIGVGWHF